MPITKQWPGGATNATPTSFSLPLNNELNWLQLTSFLQSLADSAQGTTFQKFKVRVVTASPDTISATADCILAVNVAGAVTINLPAGAEKQIFFIVDSSGAAATNNITITPNGSETVRGGASLVLNKNYQGVVLAFTGTDWKAFGPFTTPGSITDADFTGQLSTAKGGTGQNSTATFPTTGTVATVPSAGVVKSSGTALTSSNVNLTSEVTGTLPIASGGTGITSFGTGVQTALGANVTGSGSIVLAAAPTISGVPYFTNIALMTSIHIIPTGGTGYIQLAEQSSAPTTAGANTVRLYVKSDNNLYLKDELGTEYPVGGQFTWILNQIANSSESDNWAIVGGTVSTTTTAAELPLTPIIATAIRYVPTSNTQYVRYRWTMAAPFASQRMRLYFAYITSAVASGDFVVEVYTNTLSTYAGTYTKVALDSDVAGVSNLAAGTSFYESTFVADASLIYYEIRFVRVTTNATAINLSAVTVSPMLVSYGLGAAVGKSLSLNATGGSGYLEIADQSASPSTPASGLVRVYPKTDNKLYLKDDTGVETQLGAGGVGEINVVENPSDANNWGTSNATVTTTTTAANLPLGPLIDTAIEIASSTSGGYARYRWTMPVSLRQRKLKVAWQQVAATLTSGDYKVEVYKNSASDYSGSYTEFSLSTDSSGTSSIPNLNGQYQTTFDADDGIYYELRVVRTAASSATIRLAGVTVGPGIQPQGAVVGEWVSFTPATPSGITLGTGGTISGKYRRIGDSANITYDVVLGSSGASLSSANFAMPTGLTIDTTKLTDANNNIVGHAYAYDASDSFRSYVGEVRWSNAASGFAINFHAATSVSSTVPFTWAVDDQLKLTVTAPVAEWAGSGTVQLAQNDVEYAYSTNTTTTAGNTQTDDGNYGYGPQGQQFVAIDSATLNSSTKKRVRFQTPIQQTDTIILEFWDTNRWYEVGSEGTLATKMRIDNTAQFGAGLEPVSGSSTDIYVLFGNSGRISGATYGAVSGTAVWSNIAASDNYKWRVRKSSAGAAVGFGIVQPGVSSGLVSASGLPGNTTGNAIASGYVGEVQKNSGLGAGASISNTNWVDARSLVLPKGIWLINATFQIYSISGLTAITTLQTALSQYSANTTTDHEAGYNVKNVMMQGTTVTNAILNEMAGFVFIVTDALTTIYAKTYFSGTITSALTAANIRAVRIS